VEKIFLIVYSLISILPVWLSRRHVSVSDFLGKANSFDLNTVVFSTVATNIGIGTIFGLFQLGQKDIWFASSVAASYFVGLLLCGLLANLVRRAARETGTVGFIEFLLVRHAVQNVSSRRIVWLAIAGVFILQQAVQLYALGQIVGAVFHLNSALAVCLGSVFLALYLIYGGYGSATSTDLPQAAILLLFVTAMAFSLLATGQTVISPPDHNDWPTWIAALVLVGPAVFISVDNWHRITTAKSSGDARYGFFLAAGMCLVTYAVVSIVGNQHPTELPIDSFKARLPEVAQPLVATVFVMAIMSTFDTTVSPLLGGILKKADVNLLKARMCMALLILVITAIALSLTDILKGIIAVFSTFAVFLPPTAMALLGKPRSAGALTFSIPLSVVITLVCAIWLGSLAAPIGIFVSAGSYFLYDRFNKTA
jgi:SSS family solute:Na+ symporter